MQYTKPIIITGSPRSGTSCVAGILFYLGVYLGNHFLKRNIKQQTGYFEHLEIGKLDEARHAKQITKKIWKAKITEILQGYGDISHYGFTRIGFKNPSCALYIEDYIKLLDPQIVWCRRKKEDNLKSMENFNWEFTAEQRYKETEDVYEKVKDKVITVQYEKLKENSDYEIGRLAGQLGLNPFDPRRALEHFLKPQPFVAETEPFTNYL